MRRANGIASTLGRTGVAAVLCATASLTWGVASAGAAPGDLVFQGCLTGETESGPGGSNACTLIPSAASFGNNSGMDSPYGVAASPDGRFVYTTSFLDSAVARFSRNTTTGALTYLDCISGETASTSCTQISSMTATGDNSGLAAPYDIAITADGTSLYTVNQDDDSIAHFSRDVATGVLTYQSCDTGETESGPGMGNSNACAAVTSAKPAGAESGMDKVRSLAIDDNGENVYVGSPADDAVYRFTRAGNGALTAVDCLTTETATGPMPGGNDSCAAMTGIAAGGSNSGMDNPQSMTVSPDGASLYAASGNDASVARFNRTAVTGVLSYAGCLTRETQSTSCTVLPGATSTPGQPGGGDSGMDNLRSVVVSADNSSLYAVSASDASLVRFDRTPGTGVLAFQGCISGDTNAGPAGTMDCALTPSATVDGVSSGLFFAQDAAIAGDDRSIYVASPEDDAVTRFIRSPGDGAIAYASCATGNTSKPCAAIPTAVAGGDNSGLERAWALAATPDARSLYATSGGSQGAASGDDAIATFGFEPPVASPPVATPLTAQPAKKKCKKKRKKGHKSAAAKKKKCKKRKKKR